MKGKRTGNLENARRPEGGARWLEPGGKGLRKPVKWETAARVQVAGRPPGTSSLSPA